MSALCYFCMINYRTTFKKFYIRHFVTNCSNTVCFVIQNANFRYKSFTTRLCTRFTIANIVGNFIFRDILRIQMNFWLCQEQINLWNGNISASSERFLRSTSKSGRSIFTLTVCISYCVKQIESISKALLCTNRYLKIKYFGILPQW